MWRFAFPPAFHRLPPALGGRRGGLWARYISNFASGSWQAKVTAAHSHTVHFLMLQLSCNSPRQGLGRAGGTGDVCREQKHMALTRRTQGRDQGLVLALPCLQLCWCSHTAWRWPLRKN